MTVPRSWRRLRPARQPNTVTVLGLTEHRMAAFVEEAVDTLWRIEWTTPRDGPRSGACSMPAVVRDVREAYGWHRSHPSAIPPTAGAIDRLDAVLAACAHGLSDDDDRRLVWMRGYGVRWKTTEKVLKQDRSTLWRRWVYLLWRMCLYCQSAGYAEKVLQQKNMQHFPKRRASFVRSLAARA